MQENDENNENELSGIYLPDNDMLIDLVEKNTLKVIKQNDDYYIKLEDLVYLVLSQIMVNSESDMPEAQVTAEIFQHGLAWMPMLFNYLNERDQVQTADSFPTDWSN